jgi:ferric-dicitrate binding protein FerR (iron transport regulator)
MKKLDNNTLLARWLDNRITPEELEQLKQEVDLDALRSTLDRQEAFELDVKDADSMWASFNEQIIAATPVSHPEAKVINRPNLFRRRFIAGIAALLIATIGWFVMQQFAQPTVFSTQLSEQKIQNLEDGTKITISPNSEVAYFDNIKEERKLKLDGQAYFEVTKGKPFSVETTTGTIEVLGTAFDIWSADDYMRVQCFEGLVRVSHPKNGNTILLKAGQQVRLNNSIFGDVEPLDSSNPDWIKSNQLVYKSIPVSLVIEDIKRFLSVKVNTGNLDINTQFSGKIPFKNTEEAARYLAETMGWQYAVKNNVIQFSN